MSSPRGRLTAVVITVAVVVLVVEIAVAGPLTLTLARGKTIKHIASLRQTDPSSTTSTSFVDIPSADYPLTLEGRTLWTILARFSAESVCYGGSPGATSWCSVQILANGIPMEPDVGTDFAFDSTDRGDDTPASWEGHSMERSARCFDPGTYEIKAQWAVVGGASPPTFRVDDWSLTVEAAPGDVC
jgi:hypothetical protein